MKEKNFKYFDNFGVDEIYYNYKYFKFQTSMKLQIASEKGQK